MVRVIAELEPTRNPVKLDRRVRLLLPHFDAIDIPEAPLGKPIAHAAVLAALIKARYRVPTIPHIRVGDVNRVALLSLIGGIIAAEIREAVLLKGDPPIEGVSVDELTVEEAAAYIKRRLGSKAPRLGAMLSIRQPLYLIRERLKAPLDFYMVLRALTDLDKLATVSTEARRHGKKLYAYVIVARPERVEALKQMLGGQPVYTPEEAVAVVEQLASLVDGVIVSGPGDLEAVIATGQRLASL